MKWGDGGRGDPVRSTLCPGGGPDQTAAGPITAGKASCLTLAKRLAGPMTSDHIETNSITRRVREFAERVRRTPDHDLYLQLAKVQTIGRLRKVTVADVVPARAATTNLLQFMRAS